MANDVLEASTVEATPAPKKKRKKRAKHGRYSRFVREVLSQKPDSTYKDAVSLWKEQKLHRRYGTFGPSLFHAVRKSSGSLIAPAPTPVSSAPTQKVRKKREISEPTNQIPRNGVELVERAIDQLLQVNLPTRLVDALVSARRVASSLLV